MSEPIITPQDIIDAMAAPPTPYEVVVPEYFWQDHIRRCNIRPDWPPFEPVGDGYVRVRLMFEEVCDLYSDARHYSGGYEEFDPYLGKTARRTVDVLRKAYPTIEDMVRQWSGR